MSYCTPPGAPTCTQLLPQLLLLLLMSCIKLDEMSSGSQVERYV